VGQVEIDRQPVVNHGLSGSFRINDVLRFVLLIMALAFAFRILDIEWVDGSSLNEAISTVTMAAWLTMMIQRKGKYSEIHIHNCWRSLFLDKDGHQTSREFRTKRKFKADSIFIFTWRVDNAFPYDKRRLCERHFVFHSRTYEHSLSRNGDNFVCLDIFSGTKKRKGNPYSR
jgi:hypothetical protein